MSLVELTLIVVKILIVLLFLLNSAGIATWAERRQSAMVQDRVGPNRAVIELPTWLVRAIVLLPTTLLGGLALVPIARPLRPEFAGEALGFGVQAAIGVGWLSMLVLTGMVRRHGAINALEAQLEDTDPRSIFFTGLGLHAIGFAVTRLVPMQHVVLGAMIAGGVLAAVFFAAGIYAASRLPDGTVPIRLGGTLHVIADTLKALMKEDFIPKNADRLLHGLAPILAMVPPLVTMAVVPFGDKICFGDNGNRIFDFGDLARVAPEMGRSFACPGGHIVGLQIADLNVGILYLFAMAGTGVIGAAIAGWSSDNKFSLLGGLRAASQMVSYEVAMGLSLVGLFLIYGSVRMGPMVEWQSDNAWGVFVQPLAFFLFLTALGAETKRVPFDQPEGESEIVAGYFLEYSTMKWLMFMTGEYVELIGASALLVTLFFGGYALPFLHRDGITVAIGDAVLFSYRMNHLAVTVISMLAFFGKATIMTFIQIFFRWTLPRFRYDQLMKLGWTKLLPLALANMLVTGVLILAVDAGPPGLKYVLRVAADVSQALVAIGAVACFVALVAGLLEPVQREKFLQSTAARFAAAAGGTKSTPQQA